MAVPFPHLSVFIHDSQENSDILEIGLHENDETFSSFVLSSTQ